jgi:ABC-type polar amino acid transport system ATPase subunit
MTMICITHEMGVARAVAGFAVFIEKGERGVGAADGVLRESAV